MKPEKTAEASDLIPQTWGLTAKSTEDIVAFGRVTIDGMRHRWQREIDELNRQIRGIQKKLARLDDLRGQAERKPALPNYRPHDWFQLHEPLKCYIDQEHPLSQLFTPGAFVTVRVSSDFAFRKDGAFVSIRYETGHFLDVGIWRPEILHTWEFEYLLEHPDFANTWATVGIIGTPERYNAEEFLAALARERTNR